MDGDAVIERLRYRPASRLWTGLHAGQVACAVHITISPFHHFTALPALPAPVITLALLMRLRSRQEDSFGAKVIAALRNEFGGHAVKES
jgi:hypothetical protein